MIWLSHVCCMHAIYIILIPYIQKDNLARMEIYDINNNYAFVLQSIYIYTIQY